MAAKGWPLTTKSPGFLHRGQVQPKWGVHAEEMDQLGSARPAMRLSGLRPSSPASTFNTNMDLVDAIAANTIYPQVPAPSNETATHSSQLRAMPGVVVGVIRASVARLSCICDLIPSPPSDVAMNTTRLLSALCLSGALGSCAHPPPEKKPPPIVQAHSFSCEGFAKHADGSWWAGPNTLPFDLGTHTGVVIRNAGPINRHFAVFSTGENLYDVLEQHCGGAPNR